MADCGVGFVVAKTDSVNAVEAAEVVGRKLQHRGELSSGIAAYDPESDELRVHSGPGLVEEVFRTLPDDFTGTRCIIHNRYATAGAASGSNKHTLKGVCRGAQPVLREHGKRGKTFAQAFNGNIANKSALQRDLRDPKKRDYHLKTEVDTEVIMHLTAIALKETEQNREVDTSAALQRVASQLQGSYCMAYLNGRGELHAVRDPYGWLPFWYGENDELIAGASETRALKALGINNFQPLLRGQLLSFTDHLETTQLLEQQRKASCIFEHVYFMHVSSQTEEGPVYLIRRALGEALANDEPLKSRGDFGSFKVIAIPQTGKTAAAAYAQQAGLLFDEGAIIRDDYAGRSFTKPENERWKVRELKHDVVEGAVKGKKLIVVDDSIVRSTTAEGIGYDLYAAGAKEVHFRSTFPPVKHACFFGKDFPTVEELIANRIPEREIDTFEKRLGEHFYAGMRVRANDINFQLEVSVHYATLEMVLNAMHTTADQVCTGCVDGTYPINVNF